MAQGTINGSKYMRRQGVDPALIYEAVVVNNDDKRKLCRVQARIKGLMDDIPDADLPWAVPNFNHIQGAYNDGSTKRSGAAWVPKKNHVVGLRFPQADPHKPIWTTYVVDERVKNPAHETNYPDRIVFHLANGAYVIIDTRTNEIFLNNPGDLNMTILGDVNQYIVGNQNICVTNNKRDIAGYLLNAPDTVLKHFNANPQKKIKFPGLLSKGNAGNQHTTITGDQTTLIKGNRKTIIMGSDTTDVKMNKTDKVGLTHRISATRSETNG